MSIKIETQGIPRVAQVLNKLAFMDMLELLDDVGAMIETQTRMRIEGQSGPPDGGDWAEYSEGYSDWKDSQGKLGVGFLQLDGHLLTSIQHVETGDKVEIGSNIKYAATQQLGSKDETVAARPYLGLNDENVDDVEDLVIKFLEQVAGL